MLAAPLVSAASAQNVAFVMLSGEENAAPLVVALALQPEAKIAKAQKSAQSKAARSAAKRQETLSAQAEFIGASISQAGLGTEQGFRGILVRGRSAIVWAFSLFCAVGLRLLFLV